MDRILPFDQREVIDYLVDFIFKEYSEIDKKYDSDIVGVLTRKSREKFGIPKTIGNKFARAIFWLYSEKFLTISSDKDESFYWVLREPSFLSGQIPFKLEINKRYFSYLDDAWERLTHSFVFFNSSLLSEILLSLVDSNKDNLRLAVQTCLLEEGLSSFGARIHSPHLTGEILDTCFDVPLSDRINSLSERIKPYMQEIRDEFAYW